MNIERIAAFSDGPVGGNPSRLRAEITNEANASIRVSGLARRFEGVSPEVKPTKTIRSSVCVVLEVRAMNPALKTLVELSRDAQMPEPEREAQRRSFVYGNTHFENELITREMVDRAAEAVGPTGARPSDDG